MIQCVIGKKASYVLRWRHLQQTAPDQNPQSSAPLHHQSVNTKPQTQNPKPQTPNPEPQTQNPEPQTPNPKPQTPTCLADQQITGLDVAVQHVLGVAVSARMSHVTRHTSHVTRHMPHVTRHIPHAICHASHHASRVTRHVTRHLMPASSCTE